MRPFALELLCSARVSLMRAASTVPPSCTLFWPMQARLAGATNLTEALHAAEALDRAGGAARTAALAALHDAWGGTYAGLHAWMGLVAGSEQPGSLAEVAALPRHPRFQLGNPGASLAVWDAFSGEAHLCRRGSCSTCVCCCCRSYRRDSQSGCHRAVGCCRVGLKAGVCIHVQAPTSTSTPPTAPATSLWRTRCCCWTRSTAGRWARMVVLL